MQGGRREGGAGWSREYQRKCLQNDEVIDYALCRSDLFRPSRAERVISAEPP